MRRPLLLLLLVQSMVILFLYFLDPFGLGSELLPSSKLAAMDGEVVERKRFTVEIVPGGVNFALPEAKE